MSVLAGKNEVQNWTFGSGSVAAGVRVVADECAIAISYRGTTQAVLMATPADLIDLAYGFSITEGIVPSLDAIGEAELIEHERGIEVRLQIDEAFQQGLFDRRRFMAGPVGCGLCGIDSLEQAIRKIPTLSGLKNQVDGASIVSSMEVFRTAQHLNDATRAVHGAAFFDAKGRFVAIREDVGRHNAFDKLIGACLSKEGLKPSEGFVVVSSRLSVEMIQKAAYFGCPIIVAISAPTHLAIETAKTAGITLVAIARGNSFEIFTHPERIATDAA